MKENIHEQSGSAINRLLAEKLADSLPGAIPEGTPRMLHGVTELEGKATAVIGMRRAGKTTYLHQIRRERLASGIDRECLPYINFEDERLGGIEATDLTELVETYYRHYPSLRTSGGVTWCFDEVQLVPGWERFVRRQLDSGGMEFFISGSSASMLSREIATSLRGRAWEVVIHPFSFVEALAHAGHPPVDHPTMLSAAQRSALERRFLDYVSAGGFPEVQGHDAATSAQLLRDYVDVAMLRDVVERHNVTNIAGLRWLVRHLLGNAAGLFSVEKFHAAIRSQGIAISRDTVHELLAHLQDCFLVRTIWMESQSERQRMVNPRKAYPVDPGLIRLFDRSGRSNIGHALETVVLLELERRRMEVSYVRTPDGYEVDFLARSLSGTSELIQVCANASDAATAEREFRALESARALAPDATRRLLVLTESGMPSTVPDGVIVEPAYVWIMR